MYRDRPVGVLHDEHAVPLQSFGVDPFSLCPDLRPWAINANFANASTFPAKESPRLTLATCETAVESVFKNSIKEVCFYKYSGFFSRCCSSLFG